MRQIKRAKLKRLDLREYGSARPEQELGLEEPELRLLATTEPPTIATIVIDSSEFGGSEYKAPVPDDEESVGPITHTFYI